MRAFMNEPPGESDDLPIYFERSEARDILFHGDVITRYSVPNYPESVLETKAGLAFVDLGETHWRLDLESNSCIVPDEGPDRTVVGDEGPDRTVVGDEGPDRTVVGDGRQERVIVKANWYSADDAEAVGLKVVAGADASIFAGLGALLVPDGFHIPAVVATRENVKFYGLTLIGESDRFTIRTAYDVALIKYDYKKTYRDEFLLERKGGGGHFAERHDFPHLHVPLDEKSGGYIVIGKQLGKCHFAFTAFQIPHRHGLYSPSGTIHGDGTIVGNHAITVARTSAKADTVLFYNRNTISMAENVVPPWPV